MQVSNNSHKRAYQDQLENNALSYYQIGSSCLKLCRHIYVYMNTRGKHEMTNQCQTQYTSAYGNDWLIILQNSFQNFKL